MTEKTKKTVLKLRWLVLVLMGLVIFGSYYAYDAVSPIANYIIKDMDISRAQYGLLLSLYSAPNIIMVLLGGIFLDIIGIRKAGYFICGALCHWCVYNSFRFHIHDYAFGKAYLWTWFRIFDHNHG